MKLGKTSKAMLKDALSICEDTAKLLHKEAFTMGQLDNIAWQLRQAASKVEQISGRLFYAKAKK